MKPLGDMPAGSTLPDPAPLVTREEWALELAYQDGELALLSAQRTAHDAPSPTARRMGRFALELYVGPSLIDRVRFDFPLMGGGEYRARPRWNAPPSFEKHLGTRTVVTVPASERPVQLVLVDRAQGKAWSLPWPLRPSASSQAADAGAPPPNQ